MNKKLLVAAIGVALSASAFAQSSQVTLYGRINTSIEGDRSDGARSSSLLRSNGSRLGVRGTEDLGGGMRGLFGIETALNSDNGGGGLGGDLRNSYVGLGGGFGTIAVGRLDIASPAGAPVYSAFTSVWNDVNHDTGSTSLNNSNGIDTFSSAPSNATGTGSGVGNRSLFGIRTRASNAISYGLPTNLVPGLTGGFRYSMIGASANNVAFSNNNTLVASGVAGNNNPYERDIAEYELAGAYKLKALTVSAGFTGVDYKNEAGTGAGANRVDYRYQLGAGYDFGIVKLGGIFAQTRYKEITGTNQKNADEYGVSALFPFLTKHSVVFNYAQRELQGRETGATAGGDDRVYQLGYNFDFSKRTRFTAFYQNRDYNTNTNVRADQLTGTQTSSSITSKISTFGLALRHNF